MSCSMLIIVLCEANNNQYYLIMITCQKMSTVKPLQVYELGKNIRQV